MDENEKVSQDILDRLEGDVNAEAEMSEASGREEAEARQEAPEAPEKAKGKAAGEKAKKAESAPAKSRKEALKEKADARVAREEKIASEQIELTTESALLSAKNSKMPMKGRAAAVEIMEYKGEEEVALVVLLAMGKSRVKVVIPFGELFTYNPIDMSTVDKSTADGIHKYVARKRSFAEKMIGAEVTFALVEVIPENGGHFMALGSRRAAMRRISRWAFGGAKPRVKEGDIGTATITAVSRHAVAVEFNGVDVVIPQYRLTLRWMRYANEFYKIGDELEVRVNEIKFDAEGNVDQLRLDHIACELAEARDRYVLLRDGARLKGIVTNVYRPAGTRHIFIYAWLPDWEIPARVLRIDANEFGREIMAGSSLRLEVAGHDENGYVSCIALSEHGNAGMFRTR